MSSGEIEHWKFVDEWLIDGALHGDACMMHHTYHHKSKLKTGSENVRHVPPQEDFSVLTSFLFF